MAHEHSQSFIYIQLFNQFINKTIMKLTTLLTTVCIISAFLLLPSLVSAQPGGGGPDPDPSVPIDGGLSMLIAAGVGYACKKAYDKKKGDKIAVEKEK